jgi:hypothetical protein
MISLYLVHEQFLIVSFQHFEKEFLSDFLMYSDLREFVDTITILFRGCWTEGAFVKPDNTKVSSTDNLQTPENVTLQSPMTNLLPSSQNDAPLSIPVRPPSTTIGLPPNWYSNPFFQIPSNPFITPWTLREPDIILLSIPETSRRVMYGYNFFSSFLDMDYNTPSVAILLQHVCWESVER